MRDPAVEETSENETKDKSEYSTTALLEEVETLRKRVQELEDDGAATGRAALYSMDSSERDDSDIASLRKQLMKVESERADLELDFMNQISSLARENQETTEKLTVKVAELEEENTSLKLACSVVSAKNVDAQDDKGNVVHEKAQRKLTDDLFESKEKLAASQREVKGMEKEISNLKDQTMRLADEVNTLKDNRDNESRKMALLRSEMKTITQAYTDTIEKLETDLLSKTDTVEQQDGSIKAMEGQIEALKGQKSMLVDEITSVRMMMDRDIKEKANFQSYVDKRPWKNSRNDDDEEKTIELEERTVAAEERAAQSEYQVKALEGRLESVTVSLSQLRVENDRLKEETTNLREEVCSLTQQLDKEKEVLSKLKEENEAPPMIKRELTADEDLSLPKLGVNTVHSPRPLSRAPKTPSSTPPRSWSKQGQVMDGPRTPVRGLVACFEQKISNASQDQRSFSSPSDTLPTIASSDISSLSTEEYEELKHKLAVKTHQVKVLEETLDRKNQMISDLKTEIEALSVTQYAMQNVANEKSRSPEEHPESVETESLVSQLEETEQKLLEETKEVDRLRAEIKELTSHRISETEQELNLSKEERSTMNRRKNNVESNRLQVELTKAQISKAEQEKEYLKHVEALEQEMDDWKVEADEELEEKQKEVDELQRSLDAQKDEIARLVNEKEQLCSSMNTMSSQRKKEIDDLQAELVECTTQNSEYQRSLQALKMQVEHQEDTSAEVDVLRKRVKELERNPHRTISHRMELEEVMKENESLRQSVRQLTVERRSFQEKLSTSLADKGSSRSMKVIRDRNEALKKEVERLSKRLKNLESSITRVSV